MCLHGISSCETATFYGFLQCINRQTWWQASASTQRKQHRHSPALCTGLFSATQTEAVVQLARAGLRNAVRIKVAVVPSAEQQQQQNERVASGQTAGPSGGPSGAQRTPSSLEIQYQICDSVQKLQQLVVFIQVGLQSFLKQSCVLVLVEMYCWC